MSLDHQRHGLQDEEPGAAHLRAFGSEQAGCQQQHLHPAEHVSMVVMLGGTKSNTMEEMTGRFVKRQINEYLLRLNKLFGGGRER